MDGGCEGEVRSDVKALHTPVAGTLVHHFPETGLADCKLFLYSRSLGREQYIGWPLYMYLKCVLFVCLFVCLSKVHIYICSNVVCVFYWMTDLVKTFQVPSFDSECHEPLRFCESSSKCRSNLLWTGCEQPDPCKAPATSTCSYSFHARH